MKETKFSLGNQLGPSPVNFILGLLVISGYVIFVILSLPILLYRWLICHGLGPLCRGDSEQAVRLGGTIMATELIEARLRDKPRLPIVNSAIFDGIMSFEALQDCVQERWIEAKKSTENELRYPEFQQYIESWMGYPFWKEDKFFKLQNHLENHKCEENWTEKECKNYAHSIREDLLNKPFLQERSPWEIHMISNFKKSEVSGHQKKTTILLFRFHHSMVDGFAILSAITEGLFENSISNLYLPKASISKMETAKSIPITQFLKKFSEVVSVLMQVINELGYAGSHILMPVKTPWYIPQGGRTGRQFYARSRKIPIKKLKFVKDKFRVSFTSTLLSSVAAGMAISFKSKGFPNYIKELPIGSAIPLRDHPLTLSNHWTATIIRMAIDQRLSSLERLKESEKHFQNAKRSTYPHLFLMSLRLAAMHLPVVSKILSYNPAISAGLTNFPGAGVKTRGLGLDITGIEFGTGLLYGVAGVGFMILSYNDHLTISIVAENAAMERQELKKLVRDISDEVDKLYELAQGKK